jgi:putative transposase
MLVVTKTTPQPAINNFGIAFRSFFEGHAKLFGKMIVLRADNGPDQDHPNAVEVHGKRVKLTMIGWVRSEKSCVLQGQVYHRVALGTSLVR